MATFWDEIQKQYQNSEQRYRDAINTGVSMLTNKFNMLNSMQNNEQNMINNLIGIQQGQNNQNLGMFGTMLNKESADKTFAENVRQSDREYLLNKSQIDATNKYNLANLGINQQEFELKKKEMDMELQERLDEKNRYIKSINTAFGPQNKELLRLRPDLTSKYTALKKEGLNEQDIFDSLSSFSASTDKPIYDTKPIIQNNYSTNGRK